MNKSISIIRTTRNWLIDLIKDLSLEEINKVPEGFNNNIIWNVGHVIAAQQGICYKRANLPLRIEEKYFLEYKPETKPGDPVTADEVHKIRDLLFSTLDQLEKDYDEKIFSNYTPWSTRFGVEIASIDDALAFLPFHEGLHVGYVMALRKVVRR